MGFNIAIDGPAGAGKSTIAKIAAASLGFMYTDTGALYRAIALELIRAGIAPDDETALENACRSMSIEVKYTDNVQRVFADGEDVTGYLRSEQVGDMASAVSGYAFVREKLLSIQRDIAGDYDVIMDGRDVGTCVLPDADLKIYLTADAHERALRRYRQLKEKGEECDIDIIEKDIIERDRRDMTREIAPLKAASDAHYIDSTRMTIEEVAGKISRLAREAMKA